MDIRVRRTGSIAGTIYRDENRVGRVSEPATVVLVPTRRLGNNPQHSIKWARSEEDGTFRLAGIRPGEYRLLAFTGIENNAFLNDDFLWPYERRGLAVRIERGTHVVADPPVFR